MKNLFYSCLITITIGCSKEKNTKVAVQSNPPEITQNNSIPTVPEPEKLSKDELLKNINIEILSALKSKDYERFSEFIHPKKGIRFSMYAYVQPEKNKHFSREKFIRYVSAPTKFTWGEKDGSGDLMVMSLNDYLENWVFKRDFTKSEFYLNEFKGMGNSLNNLKQIYPETDFTENYIPGSEKYNGMDWNALRFVFEEFQGEFFLVAIINDEWTI
ncbi:MAG: hypothetical protein ACXWCF_04220 [Kaistella sp.]